jgi:hypothetical protein
MKIINNIKRYFDTKTIHMSVMIDIVDYIANDSQYSRQFCIFNKETGQQIKFITDIKMNLNKSIFHGFTLESNNIKYFKIIHTDHIEYREKKL